MVNTELMEDAISSSGLKKQFIAESMGLTPYGLQRKINGLSEFKASEIIAFCKITNISDKKQRDNIFFAK